MQVKSWYTFRSKEGFQKIKDAFEKETKTVFGSTDPTGTFSLFETACIGLSDQEPAALINFKPFINLTPKKVKEIISHLKKGGKIEDIEDVLHIGDKVSVTILELDKEEKKLNKEGTEKENS